MLSIPCFPFEVARRFFHARRWESAALFVVTGIAGFPGFAALAAAPDDPVALTAFTLKGQPLEPISITIDGKPAKAWQTFPTDRTISFKPPKPPGTTTAIPTPAPTAPATPDAYVEISYLDRGYGRLGIMFKNDEAQWVRPDKSTNINLLDTGRRVISYLRCPKPSPGAFEVQLKLDRAPADATLGILSVALRTDPPPDKHFQFLLDEPWKRPYAGPSAPGIDNRTLKGRVMVGYQGWFRTPNDPFDTGWRHWGDMSKAAFSIDMWPDTTAYPANVLEKAADVKTRSGKPGCLFSDGWPESVQTQFAWMRKYNIDGAFVQRFVSNPSNIYSLGGSPEWVLGNVREAANREGRIWAVEYDVSGCPDARLLDTIRTDWTWLVEQFGVLRDKSYAHENGRPVVFVWGMPLPSRHISRTTADAVVDFLKNDPKYGGNYVIGGLPDNWRTLDASWQEHIAKYDSALAWHSTNYAEDLAALQKLGVKYYPMCWPGFSWANLKHQPGLSKDAYSPRAGGTFYEAQLARAIDAKVDRLFIGMFDEYDEGTAIMPMSDDPPPTNTRPGVSARYYANLKLEGNATSALLPQIDLPVDGSPPAKNVPATNFSMQFDGEIVPETGGTYTVAVTATDGDKVSLALGDKRLNFEKKPGAEPAKMTVTLAAGEPAVLRLTIRHAEGTGRWQLLWSQAGAPLQPVPATVFVDAWGRFVTNEGKPPDWWLTLTGRWRDNLRKIDASSSVKSGSVETKPASHPPADERPAHSSHRP